MHQPEASAEAPRHLLELEIPALRADQLREFTMESLRARQIGELDLPNAINTVLGYKGGPILAADIGGDSVGVGLVRMLDNKAFASTELLAEVKSTDGVGYLDELARAAQYSRANGLKVGISYAGMTEGSKPVTGANVDIFLRELRSPAYQGDFRVLFPTLAALHNDAPAGLMSGALRAYLMDPQTTNVIYLINGSGLGGAVLADGKLYAIEPGHVAVNTALNPCGQQEPCLLEPGDNFVCIEKVAATKAGVENIWYQKTGQKLTGKQIEDKILDVGATAEERELALRLYGNSSLLAAHTVAGIAQTFGIKLDSPSTIVVAHGGCFKFDDYSKRVMAVLAQHVGVEPRLLRTNSYGNACLEGAAIGAVLELAQDA